MDKRKFYKRLVVFVYNCTIECYNKLIIIILSLKAFWDILLAKGGFAWESDHIF